MEIRVSGWCQADLWQPTFSREDLLRNNVGLLKLLVGEYRSEQTFKRREREEKKKSHACQPLLGAVASISVFHFSRLEGGLLLKVSCCEPEKCVSSCRIFPGVSFQPHQVFCVFLLEGVILRMESRIVGKGSTPALGSLIKYRYCFFVGLFFFFL